MTTRDFILQILRGKGLYPDVMEKLADKYKGVNLLHYKNMAREERIKLSDLLVECGTKQVKNTKIARKLYKDRLIRSYGDDEKWLRVLI